MSELLLRAWPFLLGGYLLGSIPTGVLLGKIVGKDPREEGSGNIGASNVARVLGRKWGFITLVTDVLKGAIPVLITDSVMGQEAALLAGFLAVFGHCFSVWLLLSGGKGVATAFGVMVCIVPTAAVIAALAWVTILYFTRIPAVGSLAAAALFIGLPQLQNHPFEVHIFTLSVSVLILIRHIGNIRTLKARYTAKDDHKRRSRR